MAGTGLASPDRGTARRAPASGLQWLVTGEVFQVNKQGNRQIAPFP